MNGIFFYIGLGLGLACACGLRPYLPALLAGALGRAGVLGVSFTGHFEFLQASWWLLAVTVALVLAYALQLRLGSDLFDAVASGAIASITHNTSFGGVGLIERVSAAEDAQAGVLLARAHTAAIDENRQQRDRHVAKRVQQGDERRDQQGRGIQVDGQRLARGAVGQARARARDHRRRRPPAESGRARTAEQARPPGIAVGRERAGEQQRADGDRLTGDGTRGDGIEAVRPEPKLQHIGEH